MIYCCVLTVYNTLHKFVNTQRDGFCKNQPDATNLMIDNKYQISCILLASDLTMSSST